MEELKNSWKKKISWLVIAIIVVIVYKLLDNYSSVKDWFDTFFRILRPFFAGLLIAYILFIPCRKFEKLFKKTKIKIISKRARGLAVLTSYIIAFLIIIIIINCIFPILKESVIELFSNIQNYYEIILQKFNGLPEESILKDDIVKNTLSELQNFDIMKFLNTNNQKILEYAKNVINIFSSIFDIFVSIIVSIYILLQRSEIMSFLRRFARAIFKKDTFKAVDKYFIKGNEVFFSFITSQLLDAVIVGILTTIAMMILNVRYAPLLGFVIGLFNMIPYVGAIVAVAIAIIITLITGGIGKALVMSLVVIILQQIDANIINPKIIGSSLKVSPLLVIFSVTVGGAYFGILGMFLGVPIAIVIKTILEEYVDNKNRIKDEEEGILARGQRAWHVSNLKCQKNLIMPLLFYYRKVL